MNIADQIMRRADRAFAEASGRILIEDLSPMERKAIEDDMERKARYVRTPAGVRRFKRPIGAIILPRGGSLDQIRIKDPVFKGFDLVEDRKGNLYDIGRDPASGGKYVVLKHNTWDDQLPPQDSLDKALEALNEKLGGGTNSDAEKPAKKPSGPKKTPDQTPVSDQEMKRIERQKRMDEYRKDPFGDSTVPKHPNRLKTPSERQWAQIDELSDDEFEDFLDLHYTNGDSFSAIMKDFKEGREREAGKSPSGDTKPQGDAPASDDNVASSDPRKRSAKFKRAADNMDRALDAVDNAKTEDDYRRALVDLEKSTVEMEDYIKSKGSEEDFARSALPKIERAKAKARSQIKRMEAKRKDQAPKPKGGAESPAAAKAREMANDIAADVAATDRRIETHAEKLQGDLDKGGIAGERAAMKRHGELITEIEEEGHRAKHLLRQRDLPEEFRKPLQDVVDSVPSRVKSAKNMRDFVDQANKPSETPAPRKAASKGAPGSPERDAFIESHPKIKDVTDYHKPKLRDMSEKNFEAYVAAVEGGKSPNSIGPIMDRIDAGASWNPITEKWVGQNSAKRPTSPTPTGDTSAADAADAAVRDRVQKMKDADRSKGRTNPYTSSLKPHQKDEVDALTPGEYAAYMNARDAGEGHIGAAHRAKNQPRTGYKGAIMDVDKAVQQAKKNLSRNQSPAEQMQELKNREKRLDDANDELGRHRLALPSKLDRMTSEQKARDKEILAKYREIDDARSAINRKRLAAMRKQEQTSQQAEAGAPSSSDAPKHTSAFLDTPISTSRDVAEEIRNIQDHAKNASHIRREGTARERVKDIDKGIEILKKLQDDKDGPMTARQRRDADTAIKYAQDVKKRLEARFSGDGESNPITAPDETGDRLRALKETQKAIGRIRKTTKFQADQYDVSKTEEAKERYANGLRQRQATLSAYQAEIEERSKDLDLSASDRTGLKRAQNALKRAQEDIDHVLTQEESRKASRGGSPATAQQSQGASSGASEALKSEAGEYKTKARDLAKRIREALSDTTSQDEAYRDRLRALDAEYTALLPRNRQIQDAHFGSDRATQDELRGVANAAQEMGAERNRLATRLNGVNIALERQQSRRPQTKRPETVPTSPREVSSPAPAQERVKGADSTVSLAKTQAQKARRTRTEKSARDAINVLNGTERDLNRTLERSGDRMPADQRAEVEQALQEIRAARAKAEENIPLNRRTHLRPQDLPALRDETRMFGTRGRQDPELTSAVDLHEALPSKSTGRYMEYELDMDALDQMVTDGTAPSVPEMNRAIRAMEADEKRPDGDEHSEALKDLRRARDYIKDRLDRERAEFEAANTSLFGDDLAIPEPTPASRQSPASGPRPGDPGDGPFRRGADRLRRAGVEEFTPNQARQVDEMSRDQWEAAQGRVDAGESISDVLGSTATRNRRDPMAPPPVSRDEVRRRLAERRAAREAAPRPDGSTTQAAWGTSTRTSLPQGGGRESDDPIQRAVERGEISTREAERRRRRAERERQAEIGRQVNEFLGRERANNPTPPTPEAPRPTAPSRSEIAALKERAENALRPFSRLSTRTATAEDRTELRRVRNALMKQLREYDVAGGGAGRMGIEIQLHQIRQALSGS